MWTYFSKWIIFKWSITTILCHLGATLTTIMYHVCIIAMGGTRGYGICYYCIRVFQMKFEKSVSMQNLDKKPLSLWAKDNETLNFPTRNSSPPFTNTANMQYPSITINWSEQRRKMFRCQFLSLQINYERLWTHKIT